MASAEERAELMRRRLAQGGDIGRAALRELFPKSIWLEDSGRHYFGAFFDDGIGAALYDWWPDLSTFPIVEDHQVGDSGSGGSR
jgi:hypothetical protein